VLDPTELTDDFSRTAEVLSGRLDSHNISQTVSLDHTQRAEGALYKVRYASKEKNPAFGSSGKYRAPGVAADATQLILSNAMQWQSILSKSFTLKAPSKIWINGTLQYCWKGFNDGNRGDDIIPGHNYSAVLPGEDWRDGRLFVFGARVQFAIRVNGRVLEWTVTGSQTPYQQAHVPTKPTNQKTPITVGGVSVWAPLPGTGHDRVDDRSSMGPEALPLRLGTVFEVPGGDNVVELVGRREHDAQFSKERGGRTAGNVIALFNRQLLVVDFPAWPGRSSHVDAVEVAGVQNEEVLTQTNLNDDRLQPLVNQVNEVRSGALAPGALRYEHFEVPMIASGRDSLSPGASYTHRNRYPGNDSETVTFSHTYAETDGWCILADRATVPTAADGWATNNAFCVLTDTFSFTVSRPSWLIVFVDVQLISIDGPETFGTPRITDGSVRHFGLLRVGYHTVGDPIGQWTLPKVTESFVNSSNAWSSGAISNQINENINVPMMMVLDFTDITGPVTINGIAPFVSGLSLNHESGPHVKLKRASIHAIQIDEG
jgi:hypothetical protein